jgi:hypothetical protein
MKKTTVTLVASIFATAIFGQGQLTPFLYVETKAGTTQELPFTNGTMTIHGSTISIEAQNVTQELNFDDIANFYFLNKNSNMETLKTSNINLFVDNNSILHITSDAQIGKITINDMSGQELKCAQTNAHNLLIDISLFTKGIYVVKTKNQTFKIIK